MNTAIAIISIALYLIATWILAIGIFKADKDETEKYRKRFYVSGVSALVLHAIILYQNIDIAGGLNLGFYESLSLMAWCISMLLLLFSIRKPLAELALIIFPLTAFALVLELVFQSQRLLPEAAPLGLRIHVLLSVAAYSFLSIGAIQAIILAFQERQISRKKPVKIMQLPPMQLMEDLLIQIITIGFFILSLSLVTGLGFLENIFAQHLIHKTVLSILAWIVFGLVLWGHWFRGWRGRVAVAWVLAGYASLVLAYFGSKFVLELVLNRV